MIDFPIPFSSSEIEQIRKNYDPDNYNVRDFGTENREKNRISAKSVKTVLIPRFREEAGRISNYLQSEVSAALVMVGNDPASRSYVEHLKKILEECNITGRVFKIEENEGQSKLESALKEISQDEKIFGVISQLPLPKGPEGNLFNDELMRRAIHPEKDIDILHPDNLMRFSFGKAPLFPATIGGIWMALTAYNIPLKINGKSRDVAILGQGALVGRPLQTFFSRIYSCTFLSANEFTSRMPERLRDYDIIVSATGKIEAYDEKIINPERRQVLIDIDFGYKNGEISGGFSKEAHRLCYSSLRNPGGSGLFTQLFAVHNVLTLAERKVRNLVKNDFQLYNS